MSHQVPLSPVSSNFDNLSMPTLVMIILGLFMGGCVKKSTFEALQAKHAAEQQTNAQLNAQVQKLQQDGRVLTQERDTLKQQLSAEQKKNTQLVKDGWVLQINIG